MRLFGRSVLHASGFLILVALLLASGAGPAWAQKRVFAKVEPNVEGERKFQFDTNLDPSDNVAPNIIFSKDGKQGFVAYAGSGDMLVFSLETGEVLRRIETGGKPSMSVLLGDERTIAVVSVLDNRIFLIDRDALELLATYTFPNALFGFGSVLAVSPDGTLGYISSTGTGEVIKFAWSDGQVVGRLPGFQGPAQITLTPDGAIAMVVDTLTEELVFVDTPALARKHGLKGSATGLNFTLFNRAVLHPDGATGVIASRDVNGPLGGDTIVHFRVSDGEILGTATIGAEPAFTSITPDGKYWVVLSQFSLSLIDTSDFSQVRELQTAGGDPLGSANISFSPDSRYAFYAAASTDLVYQHDLVSGAIVTQVLVGDVPNEQLDQPATVALSPHGVIAVLEFLGNNIDLLTDAWRLDAAKFISSAERFTGLTVINLSAQEATFTVVALNNFGELVVGEGIENPTEYKLPAFNQISKTVAEIFHFDDAEERTGWMAVFTDRPEVTGYVTIGNTSLTQLDGAPLFVGVSLDQVVPEIVRKEGKFAEYNIVNPYLNQSTYEISQVLKDGTIQETRSANTAFPTNRHLQVYGEQFSTPEETTDGYLRIASGQGLIVTEYFGGDNSIGALNAIDVDQFAGITKLYSPQFAVVQGFKTILNLINRNSEDASVVVTLHAPDGSVIGSPLTTTLVANGQLKEDMAELFKDDPEVRNVTGWVEVVSDKDRLIGTVTFTNEEEKFLTSFTLSGRPLENFLFPVVAEDSTYQTGMALLNANEAEASVTLELWGPGGTLDRSASLTLPPNSRTALYLKSYFTDLEPRLQGHLRIRSSLPLFSFSLINDQDFNFVTALPPIPLP